LGVLLRLAQDIEQCMARIDRPEIVCVASKPFGLFGQAEPDRGVPFDIGPSIHVVTDPGRETEGHRRERMPTLWPSVLRVLERLANYHAAGILRVRERLHGLPMLILE